jgi:hypothetical protein
MWRILAGLAALIGVGTTPAQAEWRRAESPNFIFYGNLPAADLRARVLLLEDFDLLMRTLTEAIEPATINRLPVYLAGSPGELRIIRQALPEGFYGFYAVNVLGIGAAADTSYPLGTEVTLLHEYAHHFMWQYGAAAYPYWYVEGFASFFETVRFSEDTVEIGRPSPPRMQALAQLPWLPMSRLLSSTIDGLSYDQMGAYYAQSWLLVHYFNSTPERSAALQRLLSEARRLPPAEALQRATGLTPDQLEAELRRYLAAGDLPRRRIRRPSASVVPPIRLTELPASTGDLILYDAALQMDVSEDRKEALLAEVRSASARHPGDAYAMRVQARAEALYGDGVVADRLLDQLLQTAPEDADLLYLKGLRYLAAYESDDPPDDSASAARQWLLRAQRADPNHFQALYRYSQAFRGQPEYLSDQNLEALLRAYALAPQVAQIGVRAATLLIARREYSRAITLLQPLAANSHDQRLVQGARRMIREAEAGRAQYGDDRIRRSWDEQ